MSYTQSVLETVFPQGEFREQLSSVSVTAMASKYYFTTPKLIRALTHPMYLGEDIALTKVSKYDSVSDCYSCCPTHPPCRHGEGSSRQAALFHSALSAVVMEVSFERASPKLPFSLTETEKAQSGPALLETEMYFSQNKYAGKAYLNLDIINNLQWSLSPAICHQKQRRMEKY